MMGRQKYNEKAVGYIRLSTELQNTEDVAFVRQSELLMKACHDRDIHLLEVYEDVASAAVDGGFAKRVGLHSAVRRATEEGAMLMVTEPTRLFRNPDDTAAWLKTINVPVFSVADGRIVGARALMGAARKGADIASKTRAGTAAKRRDLPDRDPDTMRLARQLGQRNSLITRKLKSENIARTLSDVIAGIPSREALSHRQLADMLNAKGFRTQQGRAWTATNIRRPRAMAEQLLREADIINLEPFILGAEGKASVPADASGVGCEDVEEAELQKLPNFGMF